MITGIVATDANNHSAIKFTQTMRSPLTNSFWFMRGICEGANVVTDYETWRRLSHLEEIPASTPVFINVSASTVLKKFPMTPVIIISNELAEQELDLITRLIHIRYHEKLLPKDLESDKVFQFPNVKANVLAKLPAFDLYDYELKEESFDPIIATANSPSILDYTYGTREMVHTG